MIINDGLSSYIIVLSNIMNVRILLYVSFSFVFSYRCRHLLDNHRGEQGCILGGEWNVGSFAQKYDQPTTTYVIPAQ